jgi:hypothetical protein
VSSQPKKYLIPKRTLQSQIKRVRKSQPGISDAAALQIIKDEADRDKAELDKAVHEYNQKLKNLGEATWRGLYMETPAGMVDGKMKFNWGPPIVYGGNFQERSERHFDGEGGFRDSITQSFLLTAEANALAQDLYHRRLVWDKEPIGQKARICPGCKRPFVGRNQAKTCSSKCRKRLERSLAKLQVTVSP